MFGLGVVCEAACLEAIASDFISRAGASRAIEFRREALRCAARTAGLYSKLTVGQRRSWPAACGSANRGRGCWRNLSVRDSAESDLLASVWCGRFTTTACRRFAPLKLSHYRLPIAIRAPDHGLAAVKECRLSNCEPRAADQRLTDAIVAAAGDAAGNLQPVVVA